MRIDDVQPSTPQSGESAAVRTGAAISAITGLSLVGSGLYQAVVAAMFGTGREVAIYLGVLLVPSVVASGLAWVFTASALPALVAAQDSTDGLGRLRFTALMRSGVTISFVAFVVLGVVGTVMAHAIVRATLPGLSESDALYGTSLFRITLVGLILQQGIGGVLATCLNATGQFIPPAVSGLVFLVLNFAVLALLHEPLGATSVALGTLVGGAGVAGFLAVPAILKLGYRPALDVGDPDVRAIAKTALPFAIPYFVGKLQPILERYFASQISLEALAYLAYADRLVTYFTALTASGIITTFFTLCSKYAGKEAWENVARATVRAVQLLLILSIPAMTAVIFLRTPLLELILERDSFSRSSVEGVGNALLGYSPILIFAGLGSLVNQVFLVRKMTRFVAATYLIAPLVYLIAAPALMHKGSYEGLAAAASVAWIATVGFSYIVASRYCSGLLSRRLGMSILRITAGAAASSACAASVLWIAPGFKSPVSGALAIALDLTAMTLVFTFVFHVDELSYVREKVRGRAIRLTRLAHAGLRGMELRIAWAYRTFTARRDSSIMNDAGSRPVLSSRAGVASNGARANMDRYIRLAHQSRGIERMSQLAQVVPLIRRWWWLVVLGIVVAGSASYAVTKRIKPVYEASAQVFVNTTSGTSLSGSYSDTQSALMLASAYADMINGHRVADQVLKTTKVALSTDDLLSEMNASGAAGTPIVTISVKDFSPARAALLANAAADAIIVVNHGDQSTRYASLKTTLEKQITAATVKLNSYMLSLRELSAKSNVGPVNLAQISNLNAQITALQSSLPLLNTQLNTIVLSQAQSDTTLNIVDPAQVPTSPVSPSMRLNLLLAVALSLIFTGCFITAIEYLDDSVRSPALMEERLKLPVLTVVSRFNSKKYTPLLADRPWDSNAESFKTLRTNVHFMNVDQPPRTILITSGSPSEGKTTVAANYAVAVAQSGKQVILVDCDLRRPRLDRMFGLGAGLGLTDWLGDPTLGLDLARSTAVDNLRIVTCGPVPPNPSELLGSHRMAEFLELAKQNADLVILDSPPALVVTDASVLASQVDGVLLVVDVQTTKMRPTERALQLLKMVGGKVLGIVVNKFDARKGGYGGYGYGYYHSAYYRDKDGIGGDGNSSSQNGDEAGRLEGTFTPSVLPAVTITGTTPKPTD